MSGFDVERRLLVRVLAVAERLLQRRTGEIEARRTDSLRRRRLGDPQFDREVLGDGRVVVERSRETRCTRKSMPTSA